MKPRVALDTLEKGDAPAVDRNPCNVYGVACALATVQDTPTAVSEALPVRQKACAMKRSLDVLKWEPLVKLFCSGLLCALVWLLALQHRGGQG